MPLRGAISGFGEVAERAHLVGWDARPNVNIVAIHDPLAARRHQAINLIKNVRVYDNLELMLDGEALDFVDIASPPAFHAVTARMALEAGTHVLVEKPICLDPAELTELDALASRNSRVLMCVHNWKHSPAYRRAHEMIAAGRLGEVRYVSLVRLRSAPAGDGGSAGIGGERWRLDGKTGGGILIDHGWHAFYLAQWLMGGQAPNSVSAHLGFRRGLSADDATDHLASNFVADDLADLRIGFQGGGIVYTHLSWRAPVRRTSATIYGAEAMLEIEDGSIVLTERSGRKESHPVADAPDDSYHPAWFAEIAAEFEHAVIGGRESLLVQENLSEAKSAIAIIVASLKSAGSNGTICQL